MKNLIFLVTLLVVFSSCSHRIVRTGYEPNKTGNEVCNIVIKKYVNVPDSIAVKVGEIRIG